MTSTLEQIQELSEEFRERAEETDQTHVPPKRHLEQLANLGYFRTVTTADPPLRRRMLDILSSGCGATAFLATQHEGVCRRLHRAEHPELHDAQEGKIWFGVCFAHLRRKPSPVSALLTQETVTYSGQGPWFSGWGLMDKVLIGGATEDGKFIMTISDLKRPEIEAGPRQLFAVMNATGTVPLHLKEVSCSKSDIVVDTDPQEMSLTDRHSTVYQSARSLGVARACARFLNDTAQAEILKTIHTLHEEMDRWDLYPEWPRGAELRCRAIELANLTVQAAFVTIGGRCHALDHPLQRLAREATFYSTTQLTGELKTAWLSHLSKLCGQWS